ncbi:hypothetical protein F2Q69_00028887 [Brassica cretica]|uniref:Uncharacterized protein n=1 Tax=Brassica cretica TaxID=69181 RepID=A0A8S9SB62_BRACR|nr:hypothetical protein F2Q69_00028887 [Brassica cretica]
MVSSGVSRILKTTWVTSANVVVLLVPFGSRRTLISLFSPRSLRCRASWMGAPRPSRWFLQSRGGSELWESIEVSEDTTEAGADAADEGGEVDQPADSFGTSISGYLDLDL